MPDFYYLEKLPTYLSFVKNNIYQEIKISKHVPTFESLLADIELALAGDKELSISEGRDLHIGGRKVKCKNGKHSCDSPHSSETWFQHHPHLLEEFQDILDCEKISRDNSLIHENTTFDSSTAPSIYCIGTKINRVKLVKEEFTILRSGAFHSLLSN
ncbi:hypothetical protein O181_017485 [Austropuccinia psidii MF-1]|uniref:Uncharacterized protein n=1 Tax=Austropuccinia psidii MF-1 TaxID=1389203 RepID=A0A9Q3C6V0_9BASI|nr:hypothetical protein [Austropuccinia psidii MF-1]